MTFVAKQGLTATELSEIEALMALCNAYEKLDLKLNLGTLRMRSQKETSDFLYYEDGRLVGFLPIFSFNPGEAEISGMVHPDYRRRGIFTTLFKAAQAECQRRKVKTLLLIVGHTSRSGQAFVQTLRVHYHHSEYKMELAEVKPLLSVNEHLSFREAKLDEAQILTHITAVSFDLPEEGVDWYSEKALRQPTRRYYVALLGDTYIGKVDVIFDEQSAYIAGVGVLPAYRGRGYGRQILGRTIREILATGQRHIVLEVATNNKNALSLYHSCGFRETGSDDYYSLQEM